MEYPVDNVVVLVASPRMSVATICTLQAELDVAGNTLDDNSPVFPLIAPKSIVSSYV